MVPLSRSFSREVRGEDGDGGGRLHRAPPNPSDVKINVEGAFIVDDESPLSETKNGTAGEGVYFENKDIRLPHHTAVVSHVAVDVVLSFHFMWDLLTHSATDRRITCESRLLLSRTEFRTRWWPAKLSQFRN